MMSAFRLLYRVKEVLFFSYHDDQMTILTSVKVNKYFCSFNSWRFNFVISRSPDIKLFVYFCRDLKLDLNDINKCTYKRRKYNLSVFWDVKIIFYIFSKLLICLKVNYLRIGFNDRMRGVDGACIPGFVLSLAPGIGI